MRKHQNNRAFALFLLGLGFIVACETNSVREPIESTTTIDSFTELILAVNEFDSSSQYEIAKSFMDSLTKAPFIENDTDAYFIYQGNASSVMVAGDFNRWSPSGHDFSKLRDTDIWFRKAEFESNARLDYKLVINGSNWILDPLNPATIGGGFGPNSELAMPSYIQPCEIVDRDIPKGSVSDHSMFSTKTSRSYEYHVYLPHDYDESASYPVAYFQDGMEYLSLASAATIMDNLIHEGHIEATIGVFVVPNERNSEYAFGQRFNYADFFVTELVSKIDEQFATRPNPKSRAVIGDSYGGNISAIIAFQNPDVFGKCGIHSGAFQANGFDTNDIVMDGLTKDIQVASIWGTYEGGSLPQNMRNVRDYLLANDYQVFWKELPEGHSWGLWRATIDDMFMAFFSAE